MAQFTVVALSGLLMFAAAQDTTTTAASLPSKCTGSSRISEAGALTKFSDCPTFVGSLVVSGIVPTPTNTLATIALPSLRVVQGTLEFTDIGQEAGQGEDVPDFTIALPLLERVQADPSDAQNPGRLSFANLANLVMPAFESLTQAQEIRFKDVELAEPAPFQFKDSTSLSKLTAVRSLSFEDTTVTEIGPFPEAFTLTDPDGGGIEAYIVAKGNRNLNKINIGGNPDATTNAFIQNNDICRSVEIPNAFIGNQSFVDDNKQLSSLELQLQSVNIMSISGNTGLRVIDLTTLTAVSTSLKISGPIDNLTFSESLATDTGSINVVSTGELDCDPIRNIGDSDGTASCSNIAGSAPPGALGGPSVPGPISGSDSATPDSSGGLSTAAKAGVGVGVSVGVLLLAGACLFFFCCRHRRKRSDVPREIPTGNYYRSDQTYGGKGGLAYSQVPYHTQSTAEMREPYSEEHTPTSILADTWTPPPPTVPSTKGRVELEEQQGMRHEMDARSLPDIDSEDDDEAETRSLEDIERVHRQR